MGKCRLRAALNHMSDLSVLSHFEISSFQLPSEANDTLLARAEIGAAGDNFPHKATCGAERAIVCTSACSLTISARVKGNKVEFGFPAKAYSSIHTSALHVSDKTP